jgi:hypothetical protein
MLKKRGLSPKKKTATDTEQQAPEEEAQQETPAFDFDATFSRTDLDDIKWAREQYHQRIQVTHDGKNGERRGQVYFHPDWPRYKVQQFAEVLRMLGGWKNVFVDKSGHHVELTDESHLERFVRVAEKGHEARVKAQKEEGAKRSRECQAACFYATIFVFGVALLSYATSYVKGSLTEQSAAAIGGAAIVVEIVMGFAILCWWLGIEC